MAARRRFWWPSRCISCRPLVLQCRLWGVAVLLHCRRNVSILDNCGPLVVHTDSSTSAGHFASCCAGIGGLVSEGFASEKVRVACVGTGILPKSRGRGQCSCHTIVTWLILPVVICLSQRLSHACLSINASIL